jgi:hypothetical protein
VQSWRKRDTSSSCGMLFSPYPQFSEVHQHDVMRITHTDPSRAETHGCAPRMRGSGTAC